MTRQKEAYKKMHPEQFSDSKTVKKGKLEREMLDFYLETLTSRSMDKQFEELCRAIAEVEICPNLLPQTGPTGGGDSKVDSETYPVAEELSEMWYCGVASSASHERWAFAISAKKDWKPKVKSDVKKIVSVNQDVGRGYKKIFFMSNQYISDKKRAECEDELRSMYDIDVRILDRTWMLDKIFASQKNIEIAIKKLGLSDSLADEIEVGERDYKRKKELAEIEEKLKKNDIKDSEKVNLVSKAVILAREIESSEDTIIGLIERCIRISKKYGTKIEIAEAYSIAAWTIYWWCHDFSLYYEYYQEYEKRTVEEHNVHLFKELIALWINLFSLSNEGFQGIDLQKHKEIVISEFEAFVNDQTKPNTALEARAAYITFRIINEESMDSIISEMFELLDESSGHLDLDLTDIYKIIMEFPMILESDRYDSLFEKAVSTMGKCKQDTEMGCLLAQRGAKLKDEKPYEAISYFSRTLIPFFNEQNKENLCKSVFALAEVYEQCGLNWAARNFYYYVFCICLNQYFKFGEILPILFISLGKLKYLELRLGHVLYSTEFSAFEKIAIELYPDSYNIDEESLIRYDFALALLLLQCDNPQKEVLKRLPHYFEKHNLDISSLVTKYMLGHYDENLLSQLGNDKEKFDKTIIEWKNSPATDDIISSPWFGSEKESNLKSRILGCDIAIKINEPYENGEFEVAATILATIESFLGTGIKNNLISMCGEIEIHLNYAENVDEFVSWKKSGSNRIDVCLGTYSKESFQVAQQQFSVFLTEILGVIVSMMFPYSEALEKLKSMITKEAALDRTFIFSNSVVFGQEIMGKETFLFNTVLGDEEVFESDEELIVVDKVDTHKERKEPSKITIGLPPEGQDFFTDVNQQNVKTFSIINIHDWDCSQWKGVMFAADVYNHSFPPILAFVFEKESGCAIFEKWIEEFGSDDSGDNIEIRIIKGIDSNNPFFYRIIVGSSKLPLEENIKIFASPSRVHTMMPQNNRNISMFEKELGLSESFCICPAIMGDSGQQPKIHYQLMIKKSKNSIKIYNAYEIPEDDFLTYSGLLPTDNPFIPENEKNEAYILKVIDMLRNFHN